MRLAYLFVEEATTEINLYDIIAGVALWYKGSVNPTDNVVGLGIWEMNNKYFTISVANICQRPKISTPHTFCCCQNTYFGGYGLASHKFTENTV